MREGERGSGRARELTGEVRESERERERGEQKERERERECPHKSMQETEEKGREGQKE